MNMELLLSLVPWLAILACPVMMLLMMRGMAHGGSCGPHGRPGEPDDGATRMTAPLPRSREEEIDALQARLARLTAQNNPHPGVPNTDRRALDGR